MTVELEDSRSGYRLFDPRPGMLVPLIRPEYMYGFLFDFTIPADDVTHPEKRTSHPFTRFTDDAGLIWEIDDNLHLQQARPARDAWYGLLGSADPL